MDIIIGKGENACTTIKVFELPDDNHGLSQNRIFYRASLGMIDVYMRIYKDHPVGKKVTSMVQKKEKWKKIEDYLSSVALKHVKPSHVRNLIESAKAESFKKGMEEKARQMRNVLEV